MISSDFRNRLYAFCITTSGSHCVLYRSAPHSCWSPHQLWLPHARHRLVWNISIPLVGHPSIQSVLHIQSVQLTICSPVTPEVVLSEACSSSCVIAILHHRHPAVISGGGRVLCTSITPFKTTLTVSPIDHMSTGNRTQN